MAEVSESSTCKQDSVAKANVHPLLIDLTQITNDLLLVFEKLPPKVQMEGLDILQHVVNEVMSKITEGRVTAVKFVPSEGLAVVQCNIKDQNVTSDFVVSPIKQEVVDPYWFNSNIRTPCIASESDCITNVITAEVQNVSKRSKVTKMKLPAKKGEKNSTNNAATIKKLQKSRIPDKTKTKRKLANKKANNLETNKKKCVKKSKRKAVVARFQENPPQQISSPNACSDPEVVVQNRSEGKQQDSSEIKVTQQLVVESEEADKSNLVKSFVSKKLLCKPEEIALLNAKIKMTHGENRRKRVKKLNGKFQCNFCPYTSNVRFQYKAHLITHTKEKRFVCEQCDKVFTAASSLKRHLMAHEGVKPHECPICRRQFIDISSLRTHSVVHTGERLYKCDKCDKMYTNSANLSRHQRVHTGEMPYACKVEGCAVKFRDLSSLKLHKLKHTGEKPYSCEICGMKFKTSSDYLRHKRSHTNERNYECNLCGKKFIQGWHLKQHQKMHSDLRPWACNLCEKRFRSKASLQHHTRWHQGIKEFQCDTCEKRFSTKKYLESHQVIHTNAKPFKCEKCDTYFNQISNMRRHERIHSDVKQYKCSYCPKGFKYINSWRYHEGTHTGNRQTCEKCGLSFKSPQGLKAHRCSQQVHNQSSDFQSFVNSLSGTDESKTTEKIKSNKNCQSPDGSDKLNAVQKNFTSLKTKYKPRKKDVAVSFIKKPSPPLKIKLKLNAIKTNQSTNNKRKQSKPKKKSDKNQVSTDISANKEYLYVNDSNLLGIERGHELGKIVGNVTLKLEASKEDSVNDLAHSDQPTTGVFNNLEPSLNLKFFKTANIEKEPRKRSEEFSESLTDENVTANLLTDASPCNDVNDMKNAYSMCSVEGTNVF